MTTAVYTATVPRQEFTGTGETIGHSADITLKNSMDQKVTLTIAPNYQQTIWIYSAGLNRRPYSKAEFANKLYSQGGFQPPNDLRPPVPHDTIVKAGGSAKTLPNGAVVTPDPKIANQSAAFKTGAPPASTPVSGAVITPDTKRLKKPTEAQKEKLDAGVDQFWDAFQLTGKEAKIL